MCIRDRAGLVVGHLLGDILTASVAMEDEPFEVKAMLLVEVNGLS